MLRINQGGFFKKKPISQKKNRHRKTFLLLFYWRKVTYLLGEWICSIRLRNRRSAVAGIQIVKGVLIITWSVKNVQFWQEHQQRETLFLAFLVHY